MVRKFCSLKKALDAVGVSDFLIAHECNIPYDGGVRRREFFIFKNLEEYLSMSHLYPHSHELMHRDKEDGRVTGRLAFDFDFKESEIPENFPADIEQTVFDTNEKFYTDINPSALTFTWTKSESKGKYSRHLIVKGHHFETDWVKQSRIYYDLFELVAKQSGKFSYIKNENIVDKQVARENATMRMPYNSKIDGPRLLFVDNKASFYDGLIGLYRREDMFSEQSVRDNYNMENIKLYAKDVYNKHFNFVDLNEIKVKTTLKQPTVVEAKVNKIIREKLNDAFEISKIDGDRIDLIRIKADECYIDKEKFHEQENAFMFFMKNNQYKFFCRRECTHCQKRFKIIKSHEVYY